MRSHGFSPKAGRAEGSNCSIRPVCCGRFCLKSRRLKGVGQPPEFHPEGDVWTHTLIMLDGLREPSITLALGVLLHDIGKPATFRVAERIRFDGHVEKGIEIAHSLLTRLRFPNHVIEGAEALIANHMKFMEVARMRESTLKRFMRLPDFEEHMQLHRLDCLSSHGGLDNYEFVRRKQEEMPPEQLKPPPLLTGRELIAAGYRPGPMFGIVLSEIEDAQLEGTNHDHSGSAGDGPVEVGSTLKNHRWPRPIVEVRRKPVFPSTAKAFSSTSRRRWYRHSRGRNSGAQASREADGFYRYRGR